MKNSFFILVLSLLISSDSAFADSETVYDLYLDIPAEMLLLRKSVDSKFIDLAEKKKRVVLNDSANAYLIVDTKDLEAFETKLFIAKFIRPNSAPLLAMAAEIGASTEVLRFFQRQKSVWMDVTNQVLPKIDLAYSDKQAKIVIPEISEKNFNLSDCASGTFKYVLPRQGTTIDAVSSSDCLQSGNNKVIFKLEFFPESSSNLFRLKPNH